VGTLDDHDPALSDTFASDREVITSSASSPAPTATRPSRIFLDD